jgi:HSP20 family protein
MLTRMLDAFEPMLQSAGDVNRLLESFFDDAPTQRRYGTRYPGINAWEDTDSAWIEAELPGLTMNDIELTVQDNQLTLSGQRKLQAPQNATWYRRERSEGSFTRTFTLPWEIDANKVEAKLKDGVLTVHLPKAEAAKPRKVKVMGV